MDFEPGEPAMAETDNNLKRRRKNKQLIATRRTAMELASVFMGILPDPDEVLKMAGLSLTDAYKEILTDDHLTAVMGSRMAGVKQMTWTIERGKASARVHKHVLKNFEEDLNVPHLIEQIMKKNGWGMSPISVEWEVRENMWWVKDLIDKPARWFKFDSDKNEIRFISTKEPIFGEEIPKYSLLFPRNNPDYDNPYGERLLSKCYWPITFKRNGLKWWNVFVEKYALNPLFAKHRPGAKQAEIDTIMDQLDNMVQDSIMTVPEGTNVESLDVKGKSASAQIYLGLCRYMDNGVSKIWLGETLTTDVQDKGAYAAVKAHQGVKDERTNDDKNDIEKELNILIKWQVELNFGDVPAPVFKMSKPKDLKKEQSDRDKNLKELGVKFTKEYIVSEYDIDEDHFEIGEPPAEEPGFSFAIEEQKQLDKAIEGLTDEELQKQMEQTLEPVFKLINNSEGYTEALKNLTKIYPKMKTERFDKFFTNEVFVTEAFGRGTESE